MPAGAGVAADLQLPVYGQGRVDCLNHANRFVDQRRWGAVHHAYRRRHGAKAQEQAFRNQIDAHAVFLFRVLERGGVCLQVGNHLGGADAILHRAVGNPGLAVKGGLLQRVGRWGDIGADMNSRLERVKRCLQRQVGDIRNRHVGRSVAACRQRECRRCAETYQWKLHDLSSLCRSASLQLAPARLGSRPTCHRCRAGHSLEILPAATAGVALETHFLGGIRRD